VLIDRHINWSLKLTPCISFTPYMYMCTLCTPTLPCTGFLSLSPPFVSSNHHVAFVITLPRYPILPHSSAVSISTSTLLLLPHEIYTFTQYMHCTGTTDPIVPVFNIILPHSLLCNFYLRSAWQAMQLQDLSPIHTLPALP
jgi:hypothetical protein